MRRHNTSHATLSDKALSSTLRNLKCLSTANKGEFLIASSSENVECSSHIRTNRRHTEAAKLNFVNQVEWHNESAEGGSGRLNYCRVIGDRKLKDTVYRTIDDEKQSDIESWKGATLSDDNTTTTASLSIKTLSSTSQYQSKPHFREHNIEPRSNTKNMTPHQTWLSYKRMKTRSPQNETLLEYFRPRKNTSTSVWHYTRSLGSLA